MKVGRLFRKFGPLVAAAAATTLAGCDSGNVDVQFNGKEGVPFADLDMSGAPPTGVALGGPDTVIVTTGDEFTIEIEGSDEAADSLRFVNEDGTLGIGRMQESWNSGDDLATISITLPAVSMLGVGGSGSLTSDSLTGTADVAIGGSGSVTVSGVDAESLTLAMGGSGSADLSGSTDNLTLAIGGSGSVAAADLEVGDADINIGGSGSATFASDGRVEANLVGSGSVRVIGDATIESNSFGSGEVVQESRE